MDVSDMKEKKEMSDFLVGTSPLYALVTLVYVGAAFWRKGRPTTVPYEWFPIILILYGVSNSIVRCLDQDRFEYYPYVFVGALLGLTLSIIGRNLGLAQTLFGFKLKNALVFHLMVMALYSGIFMFYIRWLNQRIFI